MTDKIPDEDLAYLNENLDIVTKYNNTHNASDNFSNSHYMNDENSRNYKLLFSQDRGCVTNVSLLQFSGCVNLVYIKTITSSSILYWRPLLAHVQENADNKPPILK